VYLDEFISFFFGLVRMLWVLHFIEYRRLLLSTHLFHKFDCDAGKCSKSLALL
jgi:hypothetical protein